MDTSTVYVVFMIINFVLIGVTTFIWQLNKNFIKGLHLWPMALSTQQIAMILIVLSNYTDMPIVLETVFSSFFLLLSIVIFNNSFIEIAQLNIPWRINLVLLAVTTLILSFFLFVFDSMYIRILVYGFATIFYSLQGVYIFIKRQLKNRNNQFTIAIVAYSFLFFLYAGRMTYFIIVGTDAVNSEPMALMLAIGTLISNVLVALGLVYIINGIYIQQLIKKSEEHKSLIQKVTAQATIDELTGIYNRRHFNERVHKALVMANRYGHPLSLIVFDIDHFKRVNDKYGHDIGDEVLIQVSQFLKKTLRETDLYARWGGEEFIVMLHDTHGEAAKKVAEKLRVGIEQLHLGYDFSITASFGVAERYPGENYNGWFKNADQAVLQAKENGRNQVVFHVISDTLIDELKDIPWNSTYTSGIFKIDQEHAELFKALSNLYNSEDPDNFQASIANIIELTKVHFEHEEAIMTLVHYPGYEKHVKNHRELIDNTVRVIHDSDDPSQSKQVAYVIKELVIDHMLSMDMMFLKYVTHQEDIDLSTLNEALA